MAVAADVSHSLARPEGALMKIGMLTTWNTQCGIAEYSRTLAEAFVARQDVDLTILGSRNYAERALDQPAVCYLERPVFDVELWNREGHRELDVEWILGWGFDVLHVQYENVLYNRERLHQLMEEFAGPIFVTWHDNAIPPDLRWHEFDHGFSHRADVGPGDPELIPFPARKPPQIVRTFGLGRTREDVIRPICEHNGWVFENAATSEAALGGQAWLSWQELHAWLRGADAIVLWYGDNGMAGCSQGVRTALATRRPLIVNDVTWFSELPQQSGSFYKLPDDPGVLEETLRAVLAPNLLLEEASVHRVVEMHVQRYQEALRSV